MSRLVVVVAQHMYYKGFNMEWSLWYQTDLLKKWNKNWKTLAFCSKCEVSKQHNFLNIHTFFLKDLFPLIPFEYN